MQGRFVAEQIVVLEDEGRLFAQPGDVGAAGPGEVEGLTVEGQLARVGGLEKVQAAQQGSLARAGRAQNGHHIAFFHGQVHALQHLQFTGHFAGTGPVEDTRLQAGLRVGEKGLADIFDL